MTDMDRFKAAADAMAELALDPVAVHKEKWWLVLRAATLTEYRAARAAIEPPANVRMRG